MKISKLSLPQMQLLITGELLFVENSALCTILEIPNFKKGRGRGQIVSPYYHVDIVFFINANLSPVGMHTIILFARNVWINYAKNSMSRGLMCHSEVIKCHTHPNSSQEV